MFWTKISPRRWVQAMMLIASNAYVFTLLKNTPCGFLNCSRCVVSTVKCPLIAFQTASMVYAMFGGLAPKTVDLLITSTASLSLFGATLGTWTCSWLCPFGTVQDMFHKIPLKKYILPQWLAWFRIPVFILVGMGIAYVTKSLFFCYVCPAGTIGRLAQGAAGVPQFLKGPEGMVAIASVVIMVAILALSTITYRPFCHLFCPIGGLYGLFNKISGLVRKVDTEECNLCGKCKRACPQGLDPVADLNTQTCNRCLECHSTCDALRIDARV